MDEERSRTSTSPVPDPFFYRNMVIPRHPHTPAEFTLEMKVDIEGLRDPFNNWGGGDVTTFSPLWEETARKQPLPGTYLTNPLVKCDEFGASLPTM